jgi:hypothetical protein
LPSTPITGNGAGGEFFGQHHGFPGVARVGEVAAEQQHVGLFGHRAEVVLPLAAVRLPHVDVAHGRNAGLSALFLAFFLFAFLAHGKEIRDFGSTPFAW